MTYEELLKTSAWKEKSLHIKRRDEFRCQRCQNLTPIKEHTLRQVHFNKSKEGFVMSTGYIEGGIFKKKYTKMDLGLSEVLNGYTEADKIRLILYTDKVDSDSVFFTHLGTCFLDQKYYRYNGPVGPMGFRSPESILKYDIELQDEIENGLYQELDWIELKLLHTHHKYYQKDKLPWEYPDSALITLCWRCHELEHTPRL